VPLKNKEVKPGAKRKEETRGKGDMEWREERFKRKNF